VGSFAELDECDSFWFSIGSHEKVEVEDLSAWLKKGSDIGIESVEGKSLDADFEFSCFIVFGVLNWFLYFLDGNFF
jgi:hypothetical protein